MGSTSIPPLSLYNQIGRPSGAKVRSSANRVGRRTAAVNLLRGVRRPESAGRCVLSSGMPDYQRLPRSPRSPPPPRPPPPPPPPWPPRPPPYPPRPPPPPPPRSAWGRASFTTRFRPPKFCPFRELIARSASSSFVTSTKAKPRDWPVNRSRIRLTPEGVTPTCENHSLSCSSVAENGRFPI